jgi:asparagine synthase (glutamine-hydrolysing)
MTVDFNLSELKVWQYWHVPPQNHDNSSADLLLEELEELFADAVKRQLVADVPLESF